MVRRTECEKLPYIVGQTVIDCLMFFIVERPSWQLLHSSSFGDVRIVEPMQTHKIVNMGYKLPN
jgi:hypothetical protein